MWSLFKRKEKETSAPETSTDIDLPISASLSSEPPTEATSIAPTEGPTEKPTPQPSAAILTVETPQDTPQANDELVNRPGIFGRLWQQLGRTRSRLGDGLKSLLTGRRTLDNDTRDALETLLLSADLGLETTDALLEALSKVRLGEDQDLMHALADMLVQQLSSVQSIPENIPEQGPRVILMVGVNGVGKTTSIAKLAHHFLLDNKKLLLAAGDTFRAAAVEQIKTWGERHQVPVIAQGQGADAASVLHDALTAAKARNVDIMIGDTAGRLHTQGHLMDELKKIKRVMHKIDANVPHEIWLVIDATTGQNAVNQAREFHQAIGLTGIILTKLDGTAKGGIVFAIASQLGLPIRYIGIGEKAEDLRTFTPENFVYALLGLPPQE
jgi:fused signal recognition particle receptor